MFKPTTTPTKRCGIYEQLLPFFSTKDQSWKMQTAAFGSGSNQ